MYVSGSLLDEYTPQVLAKTGGLTFQWDILRSMGLTAEDCVPFVDPVYWLTYFPPLGQKDLARFGVNVDWRRSFITTDYNKYYDAFVRWQAAAAGLAVLVARWPRLSLSAVGSWHPHAPRTLPRAQVTRTSLTCLGA